MVIAGYLGIPSASWPLYDTARFADISFPKKDMSAKQAGYSILTKELSSI
jgi:hypothetical protein